MNIDPKKQLELDTHDPRKSAYQQAHEKGIGGFALVGDFAPFYTGNTPQFVCNIKTCKIHTEKTWYFIK